MIQSTRRAIVTGLRIIHISGGDSRAGEFRSAKERREPTSVQPPREIRTGRWEHPACLHGHVAIMKVLSRTQRMVVLSKLIHERENKRDT